MPLQPASRRFVTEANVDAVTEAKVLELLTQANFQIGTVTTGPTPSVELVNDGPLEHTLNITLGRSVSSIARTSGTGAAGTTDTYTITYSDGATSTFDVRNGANGTGQVNTVNSVAPVGGNVTLSFDNITTGTVGDARLPTRLGTVSRTITDWATVAESGWYIGANTATNGPVAEFLVGHYVASGASGGMLEVWSYAAGTAADTRSWVRYKTGGTWGAWIKRQFGQTEQDARYARLGAVNTFAAGLTGTPWALQVTGGAGGDGVAVRLGSGSSYPHYLGAPFSTNAYGGVGMLMADNATQVTAVGGGFRVQTGTANLRKDVAYTSKSDATKEFTVAADTDLWAVPPGSTFTVGGTTFTVRSASSTKIRVVEDTSALGASGTLTQVLYAPIRFAIDTAGATTIGGTLAVGPGASGNVSDGNGGFFIPALYTAQTSGGKSAVGVNVMDGTRNRRAALFVNDTDSLWGLSLNWSSAGTAPFVIGSSSSNWTEWLRINTLGQMGLGTSSPLAMLHVANSGAGSRALQITGKGSTSTVTNKALTSNVATLTTSSAHGYSVGRQIVVTGVGAPFDGSFTITAVTSTTVSYAVTSADIATAAAAGSVIGDMQTGDLFRIERGTQGSLITVNNLGETAFSPKVTMSNGLKLQGRTTEDNSIGVSSDFYIEASANRSIYLRPNGAGNNAGMVTIGSPGSGGPGFTVGSAGAGPTNVGKWSIGSRWDFTDTTGSTAGLAYQLLATPAAASSATYYGSWIEVGTTNNAQNYTGEFRAYHSSGSHRGSGTVGTVKHYTLTEWGNSGTLTNQYGLFIPPMTAATNNWAIYVNSTAAQSVLGGSIRVAGTANPTHTITMGSVGTGYVHYNTSDETNYERARAYWNANIYTIASEAGGTGTARSLRLDASGSQITLNPGGPGVQITRSSGGAGLTIAQVAGTLSAATGTQTGFEIAPTINQSGAAGYTALRIAPTETAVGSGNKRLMEVGVGASVLLYVDNLGSIRLPALPTAGDLTLASRVSGDAAYRFIVAADGTIRWGGGAVTQDTNLYRSAADTLKTDDSFVVGVNLNALGQVQENGSRVYSPNNKPTPAALGAEPSARPINATTGTTYTLVLADAQNVVTTSNASPVTVTVPPNSSVAFPIGTYIEITNINTGALTIAAGAGVTLRSPAGLTVADQWGTVGLRKHDTDTWVVMGRTA